MGLSYIFNDRSEAGRALVPLLRAFAGRPGIVVLGVGRGGLSVAREVAAGLEAPLDLLTIASVKVPGHAYVSIGAVASNGACVLDAPRIAAAGLTNEAIRGAREEAEQTLAARDARFRGGRPSLEVNGRVVILVDDGMATGGTMRTAVQAVRTRRPHQVIVASPVASEAACASLRDVADQCVYLASPLPVGNAAFWYREFESADDATIRGLLADSSVGHTLERQRIAQVM
jgi:predicted phosphoribosyltransferase